MYDRIKEKYWAIRELEDLKKISFRGLKVSLSRSISSYPHAPSINYSFSMDCKEDEYKFKEYQREIFQKYLVMAMHEYERCLLKIINTKP